MTKGHCFCGAVSWEYPDGAETWACHCHCHDCRRNCAAPVVSFIGVPLSAFRWTGATAKTFASSPGVTRHFCRFGDGDYICTAGWPSLMCVRRGDFLGQP